MLDLKLYESHDENSWCPGCGSSKPLVDRQWKPQDVEQFVDQFL